MRILHINTADIAGGAAKFAYGICNAQRQRGHHVWLAVGLKRSSDPDVLPVPNTSFVNPWESVWRAIQSRIAHASQRIPRAGLWQLSRAAGAIANPLKCLDHARGIEDFHFSGSRRLWQLPPERPDLIHLHNLHGGYFDLRILPELNRQVPVVITMHDEWLLTGHCSYSLGCDRWQTGCGHCPDLGIYPAICRDETAYNWRRKQKLYCRSDLHIATPSQWLMDRARLAMFASAKSRVIPYGINLAVFHPADKTQACMALGIPPDKTIILFAGALARVSPFKDYATFAAALGQLAAKTANNLYAVTLGDQTPNCEESIGFVPVRRIPYQADPRQVAFCYQAADLFIHVARTDNYPITVQESAACGVPILATAVGGVPEQVRGIGGVLPNLLPALNCCSVDEATGLLVPPKDPATLALAITTLVQRPDLLRQLGANAAHDAVARFDLERCVDNYLNWYNEIIDK